MQPLLSIILPAYNCERFLRQTMDSLLSQTYTHFELIIINDGSTDGTDAIIRSYSDERIAYHQNEGNKGLIYTLNRGIALAKGSFIARMDADDICAPARMSTQVAWLESNPGTAVCSSFVAFIDENGHPAGDWPLDRQTASAAAIRQTMPHTNCIAHPSIMARTVLLQQYRYAPYQKNIEDYDLWLRLLADGVVIEKIPEALLYYRVHSASITGSILKKTNPFFKQAQCKRKYLWHRITQRKWNVFDSKVLWYMTIDLMMGFGKWLKNGLNKKQA
jgi:glycosyltransferase involved in cell wall biosynthesis